MVYFSSSLDTITKKVRIRKGDAGVGVESVPYLK